MLTALVIDDEEVLLLVWTRLLETAGYQVSTASNGRDALDILDRQPFDVIITDLRMPSSDGRVVLDHLPAEGPSKVFVCSGYVDDEAAILTAHEVLRIIRKPFVFADELAYFSSLAESLQAPS